MGWDGVLLVDLEVISLASVHSQLWQQKVVDPPAEVDEGRVLPRHGLGGGGHEEISLLWVEPL